jgi:DNA gyrase subunit A
MAENSTNQDKSGTPEQAPNSGSMFNDFTLRNISTEMESSYLDYAMSVIVQRALPDVRDGLKPVHRRILYAMHEVGLRSNSSFKKSAKVVGEVLGKYHPHGDAPVYMAMVRMAQDFAMRYTLVNGQGNFGSIDGDNPAAMRYTEAKMEKISDEMLADIDKETVEWADNYDASTKEPRVLPTKIPNLLLNGVSGIAVGMATSIPPHNIREVSEGMLHLIDHPEATIDDLMKYIKGPDFPTAGIVYDSQAIKNAYSTGRGGVVMRAKAEIEERKNGKFQIIITEIPYQVNKADLITKIAELVRDKKIVGISDLRDESKRDIRIVIELKKEAYPKKLLNQLYKLTPMQSTFNFNMIALVDGLQPKLLDLKQILEHFIVHRQTVIRRRTEFDLGVAKARAHILEGLKIALDHIDEIIATIRASETKEIAQEALMKKFKLSELQAKAILEMKLQTLAGLERKKIEDELAEKLALIAELESILADQHKIVDIIKKETEEVLVGYGDTRRTEINPNAVGKFSSKDTIPNEPMIVMMSRENYIKRIPSNTFQAQGRGGKGIIGATTKEEDEINILVQCNNHDELLFFTNLGRVFKLPVYELPQTSRTAKGMAIVNLLQLIDKEIVTAILPTGEKMYGSHLLMCTTKGTIKKTKVEDFANVRKSGLIAIKLRENDHLNWIRQINASNEVIIVTRQGKSIRFIEENVSATGRASMGVRGIKVREGDEVVDMDVIKDPAKSDLLVIMENGLGKSSPISAYRLQTRGGTGVKTANITTKTGKIVGAKIIEEHSNNDLVIISRQGQVIRMNIKAIPTQGRTTQGVYLMRMNGNDLVASTTIIEEPKKVDKITEAAEENSNDQTALEE